MQDPRPVFLRRVLAWLIDSALLGFLLSTFVWSGLPHAPGWWKNPQNLIQWATSRPPLEKVGLLRDVQTLFAQMAFTEEERAALERVLQKTVEGFPLKTWSDETWKSLQGRFADQLKLENLPPASLEKINKFSLQLQGLLTALTPKQAFQDLLALVSALFLVPSALLLLYYMLEIFVGASLGKLVTGCRIGTKNGSTGNFLVWLPRYLLKVAPWIMILLGLMMVEAGWLLAGFLTGLLYALTSLSLLGSRKQPLYDKISGTSVFRKRDLEEGS